MIHPVDRFLATARRHASRPAISSAEGAWTYSHLEFRARNLAAAFAGRPGARVLIALPQSPDAYASILASMLGGCVHTPVNVSSPLDKLQRIAAVLEPHFIVAEEPLCSRLASAVPTAKPVVPSRTECVAAEGASERNEIAYIMFTSGSTGTPKGVVVRAAGLANYVDWLECFDIRETDKVSQFPNLGFDISMTDIFGALCFGATLVPLVSESDRLTPARFIKREGITIWNSTPSVVGLMMAARQLNSANLDSLRLMNFCGEPLTGGILEALFAAAPSLRVHNTYGPTEATIAMTCLALDAENFRDYTRASVAIGDPIPNMQLHLVGGAHADEGEIVIAGPQVAHNYWRDAEKTVHAFRNVALAGREVRAYFTGDWAERIAGRVYFRERMDSQVKISGHRIELDEVNAALNRCGWPAACAFKHGESLSALVEMIDENPFDENALRIGLRAFLDSAAVPQRIIAVRRIPRNANDKIDRRAAAFLFARIEEIARRE